MIEPDFRARGLRPSRRRFLTLSAAVAVRATLLSGSVPGIGVPVADGIFSDVTEDAGITWRHFNGESPDRFLIEAMGGGVAFLDFDGDGLLDIFLTNGGETPRRKSQTAVHHALYRNLGNGKFEDVAEKAGVDHLPFYGNGCGCRRL